MRFRAVQTARLLGNTWDAAITSDTGRQVRTSDKYFNLDTLPITPATIGAVIDELRGIAATPQFVSSVMSTIARCTNIQSGSTGSGAGVSSWSVTKPTDAADGDVILIVLVAVGDVDLVTPPTATLSGFTQLGTGQIFGGGGYSKMQAFWKIAASEGSTYTVNWSELTVGEWFCVAYSGCDQTTPIPAFSFKASPDSNLTDTTDAITPSTVSDWIVSVFGDRTTSTNTTGWAATSPAIELAEQNNNTRVAQPHSSAEFNDDNGPVGSLTSQTRTSTRTGPSANTNWNALILALTPAVTTPTVLTPSSIDSLQVIRQPLTAINGTSPNSGLFRSFGFSGINQRKLAATWVATMTQIGSITVPLFKSGSPTDNLVVSIQTVSGGNPTGTIVASTTLLGSALPDVSVVGSTVVVPFPSHSLTLGTTYAIVFERDGALDASNLYAVYSANGASGTAITVAELFGTDVGGWSSQTRPWFYFELRAPPGILGPVETGRSIAASCVERADLPQGVAASVSSLNAIIETKKSTAHYDAIRADVPVWFAQGVTPSLSMTISAMDAVLVKLGSPTDTLTFEVRTDSSGNPSSTVLASGTLSSASINSFEWNRITFGSPVRLVAGTTYWIVVRSDTSTLTNTAGWVEEELPLTLPFNARESVNSGSSWLDISGLGGTRNWTLRLLTPSSPVEASQRLAITTVEMVEELQRLAIAGSADPYESLAPAGTAVSQTAQAVLDVLKGLAITSSDTYEALKGLATTAVDPFSALKRITATNPEVVDSLQRLAITAADPLDTLQRLAILGGEAIDALQSLHLVGSSDAIEANQGISATLLERLDALQGLAVTNVERVDAQQRLAITGAEALDTLKTLNITGASDWLETLKTLAIAGASDWFEALQGIAATRSDAYEALKGLAVTNAENLDATKRLAITGGEVVDTLQRLAITGAEIIDALQALRVIGSSGAFESEQSIAATLLERVESLQGIAASVAERIDVLQRLAITGVESIDAQRQLAITAGEFFEALQRVNVTGASDWIEALKGLTAVGSSDAYEALQGISATRSDAFEALQRLAIALIENADTTQRLQVTGSEVVDTLLLLHIAAAASPLEALQRLAIVGLVARAEALQALQVVGLVEQLEANQGLARTVQEALDVVQALRITGAENIDALQALRGTGNEGIDTLQSLAATTTDPYEALLRLAIVGGLDPVEALQGIAATSTDQIDTLGQAVVTQTASLALEALQRLVATQAEVADTQQAISTSAAEDVESTRSLAITNAEQVEALRGLLITGSPNGFETLLRLAIVGSPGAYEALQGLTALASDPIETQQHTVVSQTSALVLEALQGLALTRAADAESNQRLAVTNAGPLDLLQALSSSIVARLDTPQSVTQTSVSQAEATQLLRITLSFAADTLRSLVATGSTFEESLATVTKTTQDAYEALRGITGTTTVPFSALQSLAVSLGEWIDTRQTGGVSQSVSMPLETIQAIAVPRVLDADTLTRASQTSVEVVEANKGITATNSESLEALKGLRITAAQVADILRSITTSATERFESTQGITASIVVPYESTKRLAVTGQEAIDSLQNLAVTKLLPFETQGVVLASVSQTAILPLDVLAAKRFTGAVAAETLRPISQSDSIVAEALTAIKAVGAANPVEASRGLRVQLLGPLEALSTLRALRTEAIEATGAAIQTLALMSAETLMRVEQTTSLPFEFFVLFAEGFVILVDAAVASAVLADEPTAVVTIDSAAAAELGLTDEAAAWLGLTDQATGSAVLSDGED